MNSGVAYRRRLAMVWRACCAATSSNSALKSRPTYCPWKPCSTSRCHSLPFPHPRIQYPAVRRDLAGHIAHARLDLLASGRKLYGKGLVELLIEPDERLFDSFVHGSII